MTNICCICLEKLTNNIYTTECNHIFHKDCICPIINNNNIICPICRCKTVYEKIQMPITVTLSSITHESLDNICEYYNKYQTTGIIEKLDRCEGGFKIRIDNSDNSDNNDNIRQVRFHKRQLVSQEYIPFLENEVDLLFESMVHIFGQEYVKR